MANNLTNSTIAFAASTDLYAQARTSGLAQVPAAAIPTGGTGSFGFRFMVPASVQAAIDSSHFPAVVGNGNWGIGFCNSSFGATFFFNRGGGNATFGGTPATDTWHSAMVRAKPGTIDIEIDGSSTSTISATMDFGTAAVWLGDYDGTSSSTYALPSGVLIDQVWFSSQYEPSASLGTAKLTGNEPAQLGLYTLNNSLADTSTHQPASSASTTLAPNNAALIYSPHAWAISAAVAETPFEGNEVWLETSGGIPSSFTFDNTNVGSNTVEVSIQTDNGPWVDFSTKASSISGTIPSYATGWTKHLTKLKFKSATGAVNTWNNPPNQSVRLTGVVLPAGVTAITRARPSDYGLFIGDSICVGAFSEYYNNTSGSPDGTNSRLSWASRLADRLGLGVAQAARSASCLTTTINGAGTNFPPWNADTTLDQLWNGQARDWSTNPARWIFMNLTTNDEGAQVAAATVQAAYAQFIGKLFTRLPNALGGFFLVPFNQSYHDAIQAAVAAVSDKRAHFIDTAGLFPLSGSPPADYQTWGPAIVGATDGLHPPGDMTDLAVEAIANTIRPIMQAVSGGGGSGPIWTY